MSPGTRHDRRWAGPAPQNPVQGAFTVSARLCGRGLPRAVLLDPSRLRVRWLSCHGCNWLFEEPLHTTQVGRREADRGLESWEAPQRGGDSWTGSQRTGRGHHAGRRWAGQPPRLGDGDAVNPRPPCVRVRTAGLGGTLLGTWARVLPRCGRVDGPRQGSGPPPAGATREPLRFFGLKDRGSAAHLPSLDSGVPPCPRTGRDHCREPEGQPGPASQHQSMQNPHAFSRCQV